MSEDQASLRTQLANMEENLRLLHERKSQFVLESDIPLQLIREERRLEQRIADLRTQLGHELEAQTPVKTPRVAQQSTAASSTPASASGGAVDQRSGGVYFQGSESVDIDGDVIQANTVYKTISQLFNVGVPVLVTAVIAISLALIAVAQISGYDMRTLWENRPQAIPTQAPGTSPASPALPGELAALVGIWQVSRQDDTGSSLDHWDITLDGDQLVITEFSQAVPGVPLPSDTRNELELTNLSFDGEHLSFTATGVLQGLTQTFDLTLMETERMEGTYASTDTFLSDTGIIQGNAGVLNAEGRAILVRQEE